MTPTKHGLVWLTGTPPEDGDDLVVCIRGAFARPGHSLPFPCAAVIELPGLQAPTFPRYGIAEFAEAFDEALTTRFPGRTITLIGLSTGAVVALNMRSAQVKGVVAVEPFFSTAAIAPFARMVQGWLPTPNPEANRFAWEVFGYAAERIEDRRFSIAAAAPICAVVGDPSWAGGGLPSLTTPADIEILKAAGARILRASSGHDVPAVAPEVIVEAVRWLRRPPDIRSPPSTTLPFRSR